MKKLLIDCDPGIDDSVAILHALRRPDVQVIGITTGFGNTSAAQGATNALQLIDLARPGYAVPVAIGAEGPLVGKAEAPPIEIHGPNGIGGAQLPPPNGKPIKQNAVDFIIETIVSNPGEISLITLGRMTNLALALKRRPSLPRMVKEVVCMGGCIYAPGNVNPVAEANIWGDPEAADAVFAAGFNLSVVGLDVTNATRLHWSRLCALERWCDEEPEKAMLNYLKAALRFYMDFNGKRGLGLDECPVHDPLAVLIACDPSLAKFCHWKARVECGGLYTRGQIIADKRHTPFKEGGWTAFALEVDCAAAINQLLATFMPGSGHL